VSEFRDPQYGPPPGYGPPPQWEPQQATWPHGPGRPSPATAAGVLGYVTAGLTIVVSLIMLAITISGHGDGTTGVLVLGLPCAAGLIAGANQLLRRESERNLFACAGLSIGVLVLSLLIGVVTLGRADLLAQAVFVALASPLPLLTAIFARNRTVVDWLAARDR